LYRSLQLKKKKIIIKKTKLYINNYINTLYIIIFFKKKKKKKKILNLLKSFVIFDNSIFKNYTKMYIKSNTIENFSESLVRRNEELNTIDDVVNENTTKLVATRISTIIVIISWYIYGKYAYFCLRGLIKYKNYNFLFPLAATLFAFVNNTNDIANYIYHQSDCYPFWVIFVGSATLNWAPISWLQAYRLALISKIYLSSLLYFIITSMAIILSSIYCTYYFLNLSLFDHAKSDTLGCGVTNPGTWTPYIMVSDIADSVFSLASICIIVLKSINHLKELNTRNEKLNDLVGQGIIELFIIALAKIILYPLIHYTSKVPGLDVFWDILSMIVIICAYKLVNFPYENVCIFFFFFFFL